ncbi:MAG: polysaccharide deacetylase family protein [Janthinobacterium lividum]
MNLAKQRRLLGMSAALMALSLCCLPIRSQQIAFTWDDLPAHDALPMGDTRLGIIQAILKTMVDQHLPPAFGFVNGIRTEQEPGTEKVLLAWRAAGFPLGNHTWSHINLNEHTVAEFEADLQKNEPLLQNLMAGHDWRWLRFPFLAEGNTPEKRTEVRSFLAAHGYRVAGVSMSFGDYAWNGPYARCVQQHDEAAISRLEASYLQAADQTLTYTHSMAMTLYGRDIPLVLLMHVGALDARVLPQLLHLYRRRGASFTTLEQAEADPLYRSDMDPQLPGGDDTLERRCWPGIFRCRLALRCPTFQPSVAHLIPAR